MKEESINLNKNLIIYNKEEIDRDNIKFYKELEILLNNLYKNNVYNNIFEIPESADNENFINMWKYYIKTNNKSLDKFINIHKNNELSDNDILVCEKYYSKFPFLNDLFFAHINCNDNHLIMIQIRNSEKKIIMLHSEKLWKFKFENTSINKNILTYIESKYQSEFWLIQNNSSPSMNNILNKYTCKNYNNCLSISCYAY